jgi:plastocyanin
MKKLLIITILVIIASATTFLFKGGRAQVSQSGTEHITELRNDGFYPKEFTIQKGDRVKFITTRDEYFWPASNLHPSHGIYPEFDPKEPIEAEESWSFRFDKAGNWRYHDHISPYFSGVIEVRE